jgi:hypothetical protein
MPSTRTWLVVLASLIGSVIASGLALQTRFLEGGLPRALFPEDARPDTAGVR